MHMRFLSRGFKNLQWYGMTTKNPVISLITGFCYMSKPHVRCGVMSPRPLICFVTHFQMRVLCEMHLC